MALSIIPGKGNSTIIVTPKGTILFSYSTPVAALLSDGTWIKVSKFYSMTTSKHINTFLDGRRPELRDPQFFQDLLD
jgi:hypothetical protein